jgi:hypothetical protein
LGKRDQPASCLDLLALSQILGVTPNDLYAIPSDSQIDPEFLLENSTNLTFRGVPIPEIYRNGALELLTPYLRDVGVSKKTHQFHGKTYYMYKDGIGE